MAVIQLNPRTPGQRFMQMSDFAGLSKKKPEKQLLVPVPKSGGRNNRGRMTVRHRGGGHKRRLRLIDFKRSRDGIPATVNGTTAQVDTGSLSAGQHTVKCDAKEGKPGKEGLKPWEMATE